MPRYQHDCKDCVYLGEDRPRTVREAGCYVDLYYHQGWREGTGMLTRRWGSETRQSWSISEVDANGLPWEAPKAYARKKGYLKGVS